MFVNGARSAIREQGAEIFWVDAPHFGLRLVEDVSRLKFRAANRPATLLAEHLACKSGNSRIDFTKLFLGCHLLSLAG